MTIKKVAIVTGASSGFGHLITTGLTQKGYKVIATVRNERKRSDLEMEYKETGISESVQVALLDLDGSMEDFQAILQEEARVDVLVNNAGFAAGGFGEELSMGEIRKQFETNVFGTIALTQMVLPIMRAQGNGKIINISSISGLIGFPGVAAYASSKHALEGFSESLRLEMKPFGVDVVLVEPGSYQTRIWSKSEQQLEKRKNVASPYKTHQQVLEKRMFSGVSKFGDPAEVAELVVRIAETDNPNLRYPIGKGVKSSIFFKRLLPWKIWESLVLKSLYKKRGSHQ